MVFRRLIFTGLSLFFVSCQSEEKQADHLQIIKDYYLELNNSNLNKASTLIHDSIIVSELQFTQARTKDEWFTQFKWDSVFNPTYKILEMKEVDGKVEVIVSKECERIRFLHDSPTNYKVRYAFLDGKIKNDDTYEFLVFDFEKWGSRRDSLVAWIDINHPELNGFIYDQTIEGGKKYLKAIGFYENEK
jgi:hypothetical protein